MIIHPRVNSVKANSRTRSSDHWPKHLESVNSSTEKSHLRSQQRFIKSIAKTCLRMIRCRNLRTLNLSTPCSSTTAWSNNAAILCRNFSLSATRQGLTPCNRKWNKLSLSCRSMRQLLKNISLRSRWAMRHPKMVKRSVHQRASFTKLHHQSLKSHPVNLLQSRSQRSTSRS